ncbi:MAG: Adenylosuccinate lyase (EC [uncultured Aureispira sp.]|uniref:Adenylosuccinate lyase (EC) n=1 Tax=uncultured Aureispira sp. TaxID=1331704 RepID=A0A6S6U4D8_9BACT|nr:MAG: Adenylosuccinate lyase (EC [uncultured Aureispira sp.]
MIIDAISPLDGRYAGKLVPHRKYFAEKGLMYYRCKVELLYVLALDEAGLFAPLNTTEKANIQDCIDNFTDKDYQRIKEIERVTNHDVKACEIFLRERTQLRDVNMLHFALTSEDANNLAYTFMLKDYLEAQHLPQIEAVLNKLIDLAEAWKRIPFPCRTHGQKASPSTAGKEIAVFINRITRIYKELKRFTFLGKINGAVGNYSAMLAAFPDFDWLNFAHNFLRKHGLEPNIATTQIEDHDTYATYFNWTRQINNISMDLDVDCWLYISKDLFSEKVKAGEVGSSTMPHKVNPINFENSEGNLMLANSMLTFLSDKLCRSRMQRDLSDSTVQRNMGSALSYSSLGMTELLRGLNKLKINEGNCRQELQDSPELLTEPIQTILKIVGVDDPYTLLKKVSRGQKPTRAMLMELVKGLDIDQAVKDRIYKWEAVDYIGDAVRICDLAVEAAREAMQ